ncbi:MAG: hypothetical protein ACI8QC_000507 [Planctomycetota bacterium]|jgi:hypothetical protein
MSPPSSGAVTNTLQSRSGSLSPSHVDREVTHLAQDRVIEPSERSLGWSALGVMAALGLALSPGLQQPVLHADGPAPLDTDGDGLPDAQEYVLGTSPLLIDTDFDGYTDSEEVALGSSPYDINSQPEGPVEVAVGITARGEADKLRLVITLYVEDGNLADKTLDLAIYSQGRYGPVPLSRLLPLADVSDIITANGPAVRTIDVALPPSTVEYIGSLTWIAKAGIQGDPEVLSAAKCDLTWKDGLILWRRIGHLLPPSITFSAASTTVPTGSVHDPIPPGGDADVPTAWEPGQVCIQRSATVGFNGAFLINEIVEASCVSGWDSYCDPGCAGTVGDQYETVDTLAILGG